MDPKSSTDTGAREGDEVLIGLLEKALPSLLSYFLSVGDIPPSISQERFDLKPNMQMNGALDFLDELMRTSYASSGKYFTPGRRYHPSHIFL